MQKFKIERRESRNLARKIFGGGLLLLLLLSGLSCFGAAKEAPRRFYLLYLPSAPKPMPFTFKGEVWVKTLDLESAYDRLQIVFRRSPFELEYRDNDIWAAKPNRTLSDLLAKALVEGQVFSSVSRNLGEKRPDLVLGGEIMAIEVYEEEDGHWQAHLQLALNLAPYSGSKVLWSFTFDERQSFKEHDFGEAVKILSALFAKGVDQALVSLAEHKDNIVWSK